MEEYLRKRRPVYIVRVPEKDIKKVVYNPINLPEDKKNVDIIAPLNTDLSGWDRLNKRTQTHSIPQ